MEKCQNLKTCLHLYQFLLLFNLCYSVVNFLIPKQPIQNTVCFYVLKNGSVRNDHSTSDTLQRELWAYSNLYPISVNHLGSVCLCFVNMMNPFVSYLTAVQ